MCCGRGASDQDLFYLHVSLLDLDYCTINVLIQVLEKGLSPCLASVDSPGVHYSRRPVSFLRRY
jgi:hypothetical protein